MIYPPDLLDRLESLEGKPWSGAVWRHMFGEYHPTRENTRGARWNPRDVPAIYTSLERATAVAEGDYVILMQPLRPSVKRTLYEIRITLDYVVDLSYRPLLRELGITEEELSGSDYAGCQRLGGAVEWLEHDGLLVPSARHS